MESRKSNDRLLGAQLPPAAPAGPSIAILREEQTPLGLLALRRRMSLALKQDVYEMFLNGDLVMSSAVHDSEDALADRSLQEARGGELKVLIGGLGLGFTALRVLAEPRVRSVTIVELLQPVIDWHVEKLLPWSDKLLSDARVRIVQADFFKMLAEPPSPDSLYDMILIDIDDGPEHLWDVSHGSFYSQQGVQATVQHLRPGGLLACWFATPPGVDFLGSLGALMTAVTCEPVRFYDPCLHQEYEHVLVLGQLAP